VDFSPLPMRMDGNADIAYVWGTFGAKVVPAKDQPVQLHHGTFVQIWRKDEDGRWLMAVDSFNSDLPLHGRTAAEAPAK
jgi:ketosteroid isomerase-like protein